MSTLPPMNIRYPYDPTGRSPSNLVVGEIHTLPPVNNRIIVPRLGAFYARSLIITHNGNRLTLGRDYELAALYHDATVATGQDVNVMIYFSNLDLDGEFILEYQVVGGQFTGVWETIQQYVNVLLVDPRRVRWDDILDKPELYAPMDHFHDVNDIYGLNYLVPKLEEIRQVILRVRSKEMRKVWDRILSIKKDTEALILRANDELINRIRNESNNQEEINRIKGQIQALDGRIHMLESLDGVQDELNNLRNEDRQLNTRISSVNTLVSNITNVELPKKVSIDTFNTGLNRINGRIDDIINNTLPSKVDVNTFNTLRNDINPKINNIVNTELPKKLDITTFNNTVSSLRSSFLPVINTDQANTIFNGGGFYAGYGLATLMGLQNAGIQTSTVNTAPNRKYTVLSLMNPLDGELHTRLISLGYMEHYIQSRSSPNNTYTEKLITDKNFDEMVKVSNGRGNIIQMRNDGLYATYTADTNGLTYDTISALPEKKWSQGTSILARDRDGNYYRMGVEQEPVQDLGVAITVDNAIKSFVTGSSVTYRLKVTVTNSGNGLVRSGDLIITLPSQANITPYTTSSVTHTANKCRIVNQTLELTQFADIQPGGTCVVEFNLVTSSKGSFQIGAQVITNGQVDSNAVNNHASITLYSAETVVVSTGDIDTNYKFTADCPMIIPTVIEAPAGAESYVGNRLKMFPTIDKNGGTFIKTEEDTPDYREYAEYYNQLPSGVWKIKLENCSSFVVNVRQTSNIFKIDSTTDGVYIVNNCGWATGEINVGNQITTPNATRLNRTPISWDNTSSELTIHLGGLVVSIYCRPNGVNCKWQCIRFSGYHKYQINSIENQWRYLNLFSTSSSSVINGNRLISMSVYDRTNPNVLHNYHTLDFKTNKNGTLNIRNPSTKRNSSVRYEVTETVEHKDRTVYTGGYSKFFNYLKVNKIAYFNGGNKFRTANQLWSERSITLRPYGVNEDVSVNSYTGRIIETSGDLTISEIFTRLDTTVKRKITFTIDNNDEDLEYIFYNTGSHATRNGNIVATVSGDVYSLKIRNGASNTDSIQLDSNDSLSVIIP